MSIDARPGLTRHTLLVVDDEPDVLESLRHLFHRRYRVLTAGYAQEALRLLEAEPAHVVLSDQRMPGMTGDEFLAEVRRRHPDAVRLLFTGYADIQAVIKAVNQGGIFRYILKPWDPEELEAVIRQATELYDLVDERRRLIEQLRRANLDLTRANDELAESNALQTAFLEVASHEFNTPITVVQGMSELLKLLNPERPEPERGMVEQLAESSRQLGRLVATMLKLVHAKEFRQTLRRSEVELAPLLLAVVGQVTPFVRTRRLDLRVEVAPGLGSFEVDADKVRDVVLNLLTNAIKFTPDGGELALRAHLEGPDAARIEVEDKGIGLEPRALARIFEPFFTEFDPSRHSSGDFGFGRRGLGLGLSLVKTFVELHSGHVEARSTPGAGTTVSVLLPRRGGPPPADPLPSEPSGAPADDGARKTGDAPPGEGRPT